MILTILSTLLGIIGSIAPNIVKIFERKQELQHEIELEQLKQAGEDKDRTVEVIKASVAEGESLRAHDSTLDGGVFLNALRASIRPVITYSFFSVFVVVKIAAAYVMLASGADVPAMLTAVWDPETAALFGTIIAFWFGSRMFEKYQPSK